MKAVRMILYILILFALFFVPLQRIEIANLEPIQTVWMYLENGRVVLETDTEDKGVGDAVEDALYDMKRKSDGIVYLDTAEYLFVSESAEEKIVVLQPYMKGSVRLCNWDGQGSVSEATKYADSHKLGVKLRDWGEGDKMTELPLVKIG